MPYRLKLLFLTFTFIATALAAAAQQRRTVSLKVTTTVGYAVEIPVYLYEEVDEQPTFPGGEREMLKFINSERRYPSLAYEQGVQGRVLCSFIIKADGSVAYVEVLKGVERSLNKEAVRIIEKMPKWKPGRVDGEAVDTYCILPISFRR